MVANLIMTGDEHIKSLCADDGATVTVQGWSHFPQRCPCEDVFVLLCSYSGRENEPKKLRGSAAHKTAQNLVFEEIKLQKFNAAVRLSAVQYMSCMRSRSLLYKTFSMIDDAAVFLILIIKLLCKRSESTALDLRGVKNLTFWAAFNY